MRHDKAGDQLSSWFVDVLALVVQGSRTAAIQGDNIGKQLELSQGTPTLSVLRLIGVALAMKYR